MRVTKQANGEPGHGYVIKMDKFYMYSDHGNITTAPIPELNLPGLNQPFADAYQGMEIMAGVWRLMWKKAKDLDVMLRATTKNQL